MSGVVPLDRVMIVTGEAHAALVREQLPDLPPANILEEPVGRNTAPCIGWASWTLLERDPEARLAVLPADHFIADEEAFRTTLRATLSAARDRIVLFGIEPTRPETGYGYIHVGSATGAGGSAPIFAVAAFVEKPNRDLAESFLTRGDYLWNSGMFVFEAALMEREIRRHLPELAHGLDRLRAHPEAKATLYPTLPAISIDHGVMERTMCAGVVRARFPWSDVGSWDAVRELERSDALENVVVGDALLVDCRRTLVDAGGERVVAVAGVEDLIIVDTPDALLVLRAGQSQAVRQVVELLRSSGRHDLA